jgi:hypothetical protein
MNRLEADPKEQLRFLLKLQSLLTEDGSSPATNSLCFSRSVICASKWKPRTASFVSR